MKRLDWSKETTDKNYCGYCIGSPPSANCDGSCFLRTDFDPERVRNYKIDHLEEQLKAVPLQIEELKKREELLFNELRILKGEKA